MSDSLPAYVTVTDAAGRVLFRRPATAAEVEEAIQVAQAADAEAQAVLKRIAEERAQGLAAEPRVAEIAPQAAATDAPPEVPAETTLLEEGPFPVEAQAHDDEFEFLSALDDTKEDGKNLGDFGNHDPQDRR